jgi:hypothetical protein
MDHHTFVTAYRAGAIKVRVNRDKAGFLYADPHFLPRSVRRRQAIQRLIGFVGVVGGAISFLWLPWWGSILILVFFLASFREIAKAAAEGVLEAALEYPQVFSTAQERGVIRVDDG